MRGAPRCCATPLLPKANCSWSSFRTRSDDPGLVAPAGTRNKTMRMIAMKVCRDVEEWIQENVEQEVEQQEQRCKKWPWPLSWLCSNVTFIAKSWLWS